MYGAEAVQEAIRQARDDKRPDHIAAAAEWLEANAERVDGPTDRGASRADAHRPRRLPCDACQRSEWVDALTVKDGRALCRDCAAPSPDEDRRNGGIAFGELECRIVTADERDRLIAGGAAGIGVSVAIDAPIFTDAELAWEREMRRLARELAARRGRGRHMSEKQKADEMAALAAQRPPVEQRMYRVYVRRATNGAGGSAGGGEAPQTPAARIVAEHWRSVLGDERSETER